MNPTAHWLLGCAALVLSGCPGRPAPRCLEGICLDVGAEATVTSDGRRHTVRLPGLRGWIDIQRVVPEPQLPSDLADVAHLLASRHASLGGATTLRESVGTLAGRRVAVEEAVLHRRAGDYRRITYVVPRATDALAIDETARVEDFAEAHDRLRPILDHLAWSQP